MIILAKEIICGIYKIENLVNDKVYIGQSKNINERIRKHKESLKYNHHFNKHLQRSWNKYGENNFKFNVIDICDYELLNDKEQFYINKYNSMNSNCGYNKESGGKVKKLSDETKIKISLSRIGMKISEDTRKKMSLSHIGENNSFYNQKHSEEFKKKMSVLKKGIPLSSEHREKIKDTGVKFKEGKDHPNSIKVYKLDVNNFNVINIYDSMRIADKEEFNNVHGIVRNHVQSKTPERNYYWIDEYNYSLYKDSLITYFKSVNNYNRKEVYQLDLDNNLIKKWDTVKEASLTFKGKIQTSISQCVQKKCKTAYGYKWLYKDDYEKLIS